MSGLRMPAELVARAREIARGQSSWTPPEARPAATVVLVRDGAAGLEVLLMRRPSTMAFAPGMHVFPGGRVDPGQDGRPLVSGSLTGGSWAAPELARALIAAAVRETFEEAGVLLALDRRGRPAVPDEGWERDRAASQTALAFPEVLVRRGLHLDADLLVPVAHWVTPEVESRRFDTRFLMAELPVGQEVRPHATETDLGVWLAPAEALSTHAAGELPMLPPTVAVLAGLASQPTVAHALADARGRTITPLLPQPVPVGDGIDWALVHAYTGAVLGSSSEPAGSEVAGLTPPKTATG